MDDILAVLLALFIIGAVTFCTVGFWAIGALYVMGFLP
jgi:hypothetical protein